MTVALLHGFVRDSTDAWQYTIDHLGLFFEHAIARSPAGPPAEGLPEDAARELLGTYLEAVRLLGTRTGQLHAALAAQIDEPAFAPEPYTDFYRYGLYHGILTRFSRVMEQLRSRLAHVPEAARADADAILSRQAAIRSKIQFLRDQRLDAMRIRTHGDFHLSQALYTGKDFVFIDFEGDASRPFSERRIKRSPLHDIAGMLDSFFSASRSVLFGEAPGVTPKPEILAGLEAWARFWSVSVSREYVRAYRATPGVAELLPSDPTHFRSLLIAILLDCYSRKLSLELESASERVRIPLRAIVELVEES